MLNGHIDPTFLHTYVKTKPTAIPKSHFIAIYVQETYMPHICHICTLFHVYI